MSEELKPCPFCGSSNVEIIEGVFGKYGACRSCCAYGPDSASGCAESAAEKWNRRHVPGESNSPAPVEEPHETDHTVWITELELRIAKLERYVRSEQALKER